jgi:superfamily II DNA helicase RecQ
VRPVVISRKTQVLVNKQLNSLFFGSKSVNVKNAVSKGLSNGFQIPFTFHDYRQVCSMILHQHFDTNYMDCGTEESEDFIDILHNQAGHSSATARAIYGYSRNKGTTTTPKGNIDKYFDASLKWHSFHGFEDQSESISISQFCNVQLGPQQRLIETSSQSPGPPHTSAVENILTSGGALNSNRILRTMQKVVGSSCTSFRSVEQYQTVRCVLEMKNTISILPTGHGKSTLIMAIPYLEPDKTTIVVPLFQSLRHDLISTFGKHQIPFEDYQTEWQADIMSLRGKLLIMSVNQASQVNSCSIIQKLYEIRQLNRIVVDECHEFVYSVNYRQDIIDLRNLLSTIPVPLVLLSATLSPKAVSILSEFFNRSFEIIRCSTVRPNLKFIVKIDNEHTCNESECSKWQFKFVSTILRQRKNEFPEYRAIVYVTSRTLVWECQKNLFGIPTNTYISGVINNHSEMLNWNERGCVMIATTAFGQGINNHLVSDVFILGYTYKMADISQMAGRAGRNNQDANVFLISCERVLERVCPTLFPDLESSYSNYELKKVVDFFRLKDCYRRFLHSEIDGVGYRCLELPNTVYCSNCEKLATQSSSSSAYGNDTSRFEKYISV